MSKLILIGQRVNLFHTAFRNVMHWNLLFIVFVALLFCCMMGHQDFNRTLCFFSYVWWKWFYLTGQYCPQHWALIEMEIQKVFYASICWQNQHNSHVFKYSALLMNSSSLVNCRRFAFGKCNVSDHFYKGCQEHHIGVIIYPQIKRFKKENILQNINY